MRYDWTPLWRSTIGFDHLFDVLDEVQRTSEETYPPYNIERTDDNHFQISVALAGFAPEEVALTVEQNVLTLEGRKTEKEERLFLHRGISARSFKRQFTLADHVEVKGARFENGLLIVDLVREIPETMKPRRIAIGSEPDRSDGRLGRIGQDCSSPPCRPGTAAHTQPRQVWRRPCGGRPRMTTTFSISIPCFTPAPSSRIPAMSLRTPV
jgi:molecular chaperone IbpA